MSEALAAGTGIGEMARLVGAGDAGRTSYFIALPLSRTTSCGTILTTLCCDVMTFATGTRTMMKSALLGIGLVAAVTTTAAAQLYYPYSYPGYSYYSYPGYSYPTYNYPWYGYPYGYSAYYGSPNYYGWYGWPNYYGGPAYQAAPAYADPYVWWRPYSDNAGPKASTRGGY